MEESEASTVPDGELIGIKFGLASDHEIRTSSISDCPISHASQLANPFLGLPLEMGKCKSCGTAEPGKCEGHFGYIELPIPIYHPSHVIELKCLLSLVCLKCLKMKSNKFPVKNNGVAEKLLSACCGILINPQGDSGNLGGTSGWNDKLLKENKSNSEQYQPTSSKGWD